MHQNLISNAVSNIRNIIHLAIKHDVTKRALVVYDTQNGLTNILTQAYRIVLPEATFVDFDSITKEEAKAQFDSMNEGDLVVLIQTSNFMLNAFRIRLHLFNKKLKVIEHMHLYRNSEDVWDVYINSLAYDPSWYITKGHALKSKLENTKELIIKGGNGILTVKGELESPKLNVGDYTGMDNIGGTFPIGEVFTEAKDLSTMNGSFFVYAFADKEFNVNMNEPFRVEVESGIITSWDETIAPTEFREIIEMVRSEERAVIREIGFGLNKSITKERYLQDITAFERILGMHLSLGEKHGTYKKDGIVVAKSKYHIDLFPVVDEVLADGEAIFKDGVYLL